MLNNLFTIHPVEWSILLAGFVISFIGTGLKGFQTKNVTGNHYRMVVITSYFMSLFDVMSVGLIVHNGLVMALPVGTGASLGMVCAMKLHQRFVKESK